jgi:DNA-binding GntR family transcriptional regulator
MTTSAPHTSTRAENVAETLREGLRHSKYLSGERLVEITLAQEMQVSQNTIRDALRILEQEGWVVKKARRGVFVHTFDQAQIDELCTLRTTLEGLILDWSLPNLTGHDLKQLHRCLDKAAQYIETMRWFDARQALLRFHTTLVQSAKKPQTADMLARLYNQSCLLENLREMRAPRGLHGWSNQIRAYQTLLQTIETGDVAQAQQTLDDILKADCAGILACF